MNIKIQQKFVQTTVAASFGGKEYAKHINTTNSYKSNRSVYIYITAKI